MVARCSPAFRNDPSPGAEYNTSFSSVVGKEWSRGLITKVLLNSSLPIKANVGLNAPRDLVVRMTFPA